jgi:hypothetical protein
MRKSPSVLSLLCSTTSACSLGKPNISPWGLLASTNPSAVEEYALASLQGDLLVLVAHPGMSPKGIPLARSSSA